MELVLTFPLPPRGLRPNSPGVWQVKQALARVCREQGRRAMFDAAKKIPAEVWCLKSYSLRGYFKTSRHWDDDNLSASAKNVRDGIAETARQDDRTFKCTGVQTFTDRENPRLEVILEVEEIL